MTRMEARQIIEKYADRPVLREEDDALLRKALEYMISDTGDPQWMVDLGGYYYRRGDYEQARRMYEMADDAGHRWAAEALGQIWELGLSVGPDPEKALMFYRKAMEHGSIRAMIRIADMYRSGEGTEKDPEKYEEMIEEAHRRIRDTSYLSDPLPEVYLRLAEIRSGQGKTEEASGLCRRAAEFLSERIRWEPFKGDEELMERLEKLKD